MKTSLIRSLSFHPHDLTFARTLPCKAQAAEPLFTAVFSALLASQVFAWPVYATLLPVVGGVAVASMKELTFK